MYVSLVLVAFKFSNAPTKTIELKKKRKSFLNYILFFIGCLHIKQFSYYFSTNMWIPDTFLFVAIEVKDYIASKNSEVIKIGSDSFSYSILLA